jgi:hypothetical protein
MFAAGHPSMRPAQGQTRPPVISRFRSWGKWRERLSAGPASGARTPRRPRTGEWRRPVISPYTDNLLDPDAIARLVAEKPPLAIVIFIGSEDELFYADRYGPLIHGVRPDAPVNLVAGVDHMGMVTDPRAPDADVIAIR